MYLFLDFSQRS